MSKIEILVDGKSELSGDLVEMNVSYQHPHVARAVAPRRFREALLGDAHEAAV